MPPRKYGRAPSRKSPGRCRAGVAPGRAAPTTVSAQPTSSSRRTPCGIARARRHCKPSRRRHNQTGVIRGPCSSNPHRQSMSTVPAAMKAVVAPKPGGPEALTIVERPVPRPSHGEVLIRVAAAGLNGADLTQRMGRYEMPPGATDILGLEASGTIVALGDGVTDWKVGDEVCALLIGGGYADYVAAPAVQCLPVPRGVSLVEAAGLPEVVITVWLNVFELAALQPGERLLVHGGAS